MSKILCGLLILHFGIFSLCAEELSFIDRITTVEEYEGEYYVKVANEAVFYRELQKFDSLDDFCKQLNECLFSKSSKERLAVLEFINEYRDRLRFSEEQLSDFVQILDSEESEACRELAIYLLVHFRYEKAVPSFLHCLNDSNMELESAAAWALGEIAPPSNEVIEALFQYTSDPRESLFPVTMDCLEYRHIVAEQALTALGKIAKGRKDVHERILKECISPETWKSFDEKKLDAFFEKIASTDLREEEFWRCVSEAGLDQFSSSNEVAAQVLFEILPDDSKSIYLFASYALAVHEKKLSNLHLYRLCDSHRMFPILLAIRTCLKNNSLKMEERGDFSELEELEELEWDWFKRVFRTELSRRDFERYFNEAKEFATHLTAWKRTELLYWVFSFQPQYFDLYEPLLMEKFSRGLKSYSMEHNFVRKLAKVLAPDEFARFVLEFFDNPKHSHYFAKTCLWIDSTTVKRLQRESEEIREKYGLPSDVPEETFCISIPSPKMLLTSLEQRESQYPNACQSKDYRELKSRLRILEKYSLH